MDTLTPADLHARRARLRPGLLAPGAARAVVHTAVADWNVPADDGDLAILLTSDLVTSVIGRSPGRSVTLGVGYAGRHLRVEAQVPGGDIPDRGKPDPLLTLVDRFSHDWGFYRTPAGVTAYFRLQVPGPPHGAGGSGGEVQG
jgi:hypothetical protein